ncbi:hypothetical protein Cadr_000003869 [Camelus dromedarius]|uniref:Uncharacterized protein n=1 Tax=Camelus dromedarius TaxID=9838 RepID=A0A5N4EC10_CAMDR|nr:hypothetical protein Cadr_000003869 [Camelus dromedarius]
MGTLGLGPGHRAVSSQPMSLGDSHRPGCQAAGFQIPALILAAQAEGKGQTEPATMDVVIWVPWGPGTGPILLAAPQEIIATGQTLPLMAGRGRAADGGQAQLTLGKLSGSGPCLPLPWEPTRGRERWHAGSGRRERRWCVEMGRLMGADPAGRGSNSAALMLSWGNLPSGPVPPAPQKALLPSLAGAKDACSSPGTGPACPAASCSHPVAQSTTTSCLLMSELSLHFMEPETGHQNRCGKKSRGLLWVWAGAFWAAVSGVVRVSAGPGTRRWGGCCALGRVRSRLGRHWRARGLLRASVMSLCRAALPLPSLGWGSGPRALPADPFLARVGSLSPGPSCVAVSQEVPAWPPSPVQSHDLWGWMGSGCAFPRAWLPRASQGWQARGHQRGEAALRRPLLGPVLAGCGFGGSPRRAEFSPFDKAPAVTRLVPQGSPSSPAAFVHRKHDIKSSPPPRAFSFAFEPVRPGFRSSSSAWDQSPQLVLLLSRPRLWGPRCVSKVWKDE